MRFDEQVEKENVVFCIAQPPQYDYAHLVHTKEWDWDAHKYKYWISNLKGRLNGHCYLEHIFGKLVQVLH